jgi:hypothetical protein
MLFPGADRLARATPRACPTFIEAIGCVEQAPGICLSGNVTGVLKHLFAGAA